MKLFSEKVNSTFTNSSFNVLQVENFSEIFFDVYEIELNKIKYPAEKIDEHDGHPVVSVPVVIGEQEYKYPFVLLKGPFEVLFNEKNDSVIEIPEAPELIEESIEEVEDVAETTNFEVQPNYDDLIRENSKKEILNQIKIAKQQAAKKIKKLKESALSEATFDIKLKKKEFDKTLQDAKDTLVNEFVQISNNIKSELLDANNDRYSEIKDTVSAKIGLLAENLQSNITEDFKSASKSFDANIRALVMELHTSSVLPKLKDELTVIASDVVEKVSKIEESLNDKLSNKVDVSMLEGVNNEINAIQIANVELNNNINKGVNKALSRLGNVNNKIDDAIVDLSESVDIKIKSATDNITNYYSSKIKELEDQTFEINESSRKYFIDLIQESKNNLIQEIRNIKKDAPIEYVIESKTGRTSRSFDSLTSDLDKKISDKISDEVIRLRKYISLYSGGGTVAQQFAAGGIMNGDLTVVGSISASNYLGLVIPNPDLSQYLPISGGTITGDLTVRNTLSAYSLSADRIFTSQLDALSANITVIDIKQYELSGFNVTGDCTIQGSVSSNDAVYGSNLVYLGGNTAGSNLIIGTNDSYNLALETGGVARMTILSSGDITVNNNMSILGNLSAGTISLSSIGGSNPGIYFYGRSAQNVPPSIYQKADDGIVITAALGTGKTIEIGGGTSMLTMRSLGLGITFANGSTGITTDATNNVLALRNTTSATTNLAPQEFRIYNTYTSATSAERTAFKYVNNNFVISTESLPLSAPQRSMLFQTASATRMTILNSGNVGIGVESPTQGKLVIDAPIAGTNRNLVFQQSIAAAGQVNEIVWRSSAGTIFDYSKIKTSYGNSFFNSYFTIQVANSALALQDRFHIDVAGNVGIGTTTPNEKLTVVGNISASGTSNTLPNQTAASTDFTAIATQEMVTPFPTFGGPPPYYRIFEDFPNGSVTSGSMGTHGWTNSGSVGSGVGTASFNISNTTLVMGAILMNTGATLNNFRSIYLPTGGTSSVGNTIHTLFAAPTATDIDIFIGFSGGGSSDGVQYSTLSGAWNAIKGGSGGSFSNLLVTTALSAGNFTSGTRYKVSMTRPSATSTRVHIATAPWNSATWTTVYNDTVTHASQTGGWNQVFPTFQINTLTSADRSVMIDYIGVEKLIQR